MLLTTMIPQNDLLGVVIESYTTVEHGVDVEIRVDLLFNSTLTQNDIDVAFNGGLTGRNEDFIEPDSRVYRELFNDTSTPEGWFIKGDI